MATNSKKEILVYAHWKGLQEAQLMGYLQATSVRGKESFSFEYSKEWIKSGFTQMIDPELQLYPGSFFPKDEKVNFGAFLDSCPDRWGRVLMQRKEAIIAKQEKRNPRTLLESDYLLGVYDGHRMGALRFKTEVDGVFLNDNNNMAIPPWTDLRKLEHASLQFEEDNQDNPEYLSWLNLLIAPGSSLGGARPKASVMDADKNLWIAKFPSKNDDKNIGAWEMVVNELAINAGLNVAKGMAQKFKNKYHTFLSQRFDRTKKGERIHFASAMTMLGYMDGENASGASYLEIAEFLIKHGANVNLDLEELWRRIVFNICVKNTDDHLRNHGFLLTENGWTLSPAYDMNANEFGKELSLNISDKDNSLDLSLALDVSEYFRVDEKQTSKIIKKVQKSVGQWQEVAKKNGISKSEQERMQPAFQID